MKNEGKLVNILAQFITNFNFQTALYFIMGLTTTSEGKLEVESFL